MLHPLTALHTGSLPLPELPDSVPWLFLANVDMRDQVCSIKYIWDHHPAISRHLHLRPVSREIATVCHENVSNGTEGSKAKGSTISRSDTNR